MIKIQEHISSKTPNPDAFLDGLALAHWTKIAKPNSTTPVSYKYGSIVNRCEKYKNMARALDADYLNIFAPKNDALAKRQAEFLNYLSTYNYGTLKRIVTGRPLLLESVRSKIKQRFGEDLFFDDAAGSQTEFGKLISEKIFNYKTFRSSDSCAELMQKIGFRSARCPYCGDFKVQVVPARPDDTPNKRAKALLDLDHYYSKSRDPYFAVSFFNLIPSCHPCNASYKNEIVFELNTHIHPYHESFDDYYVFGTKASVGSTPDTIVLNLRPNITRALENHKDFDLEARYQSEKQELLDIEIYYSNNLETWVKDESKTFKEYLLKGLPKDKSDYLRHERAKAKLDILKSIDFMNIFSTP